MTEKEWNTFMKDLDESNMFVKDNVFCYFYNNSSNCLKCPRLKTCKEKIHDINMLTNELKIETEAIDAKDH